MVDPVSVYNFEGLEDAHPVLSNEHLLCMYIFPKCTFPAQKRVLRTCSFWRELWHYKAWVPRVVERNINSKRWWVARDIMSFNTYEFHNSHVKDWVEFCDGFPWLFAGPNEKKRKREEADHRPCKRRRLWWSRM